MPKKNPLITKKIKKLKKIFELSKTPSPVTLTFGKYKGEKIDLSREYGELTVEVSYLKWLYDQSFVKQQHGILYNYLDFYKNRIIELQKIEIEEDFESELYFLHQNQY